MNTIQKNYPSRLSRFAGHLPARSRFSWLGGLAAVSIALLSSAQTASATELLNEPLTDGALPTGWAQVDVSFQTTSGGYARFDETTATLTTSSIDASGFDAVELALSVAKFGTGDNGPITVEYSLNGGSDWTTFGVTSTPTGSTYINDVLTINAASADMQLRFSRPDSPSQKRLRNIVINGLSLSGPPSIADVVISELQAEEATATAAFAQNAGANFTEYGFAVAEAATNPSPEIGGTGVALVDFDPSIDPLTASIEAVLTGLTAETEYAVRAYVIYDSGAETIYSPTATTFTTLTPPPPPEPAPTLDGVTDYTQDFSGFVSDISLPTGWAVTSNDNPYSTYGGDWGTGTSSGLRGNASVLGMQHTSSSGIIVKTLTIQNTSGAEITELFVSYDGRVARETEGRNPIYTVTVDGATVATLSYDTLEGDGVTKSAVVTGLAIPDGAFFEITWTSERGDGGGSSKQIGISNLLVSLDIPSAIAPAMLGITFPDPVEFPVTTTGFSVDSGVLAAGSDTLTSVGFVIAETALQANPLVGDPDTTVIELFDDFDPDFSLIFYDFVGLTPGTSYSVRSFATSAAGTGYSAAITQATLSLPASLTATGYAENFLSFTGVESLPSGWSAVGPITSYGGDWGTGSSAGFRGPADGATVGVVGYQHTSGSGTITLNLEMTNDTGAEITALEISYLGRVERADQTRLPIWTVEVDGIEVPALAYSTGAGVDQTVSTTVTGLSIAEGATFTISWSSDRGESDGSSRQIGIADVTVESVAVSVTPPVLSLDPGTYFEDKTVFVSNFASLGAGVEVRYTLDGSDPAAGVGSLYDNGTGILIEDGSGPVQLRAISVDTATSEVSPIVAATYTFPLDVADIAAFRAGTAGTLYRITGETVVVHRNGFRNRHYIQDGSGSLTVWDDNSPNLITTDYLVGDGVTGLVGTHSVVNNGALITLQVADADPGAPTSSSNPIEPVTVNLSTLDLSYTGALVRINNVDFGTTGTFSNGTNYSISDPSGSSTVRTDFFGADYTGEAIPEEGIDLIAIVGGFGSSAQITPRSLADFLPASPILGDAFDDFVAVAPEGQRGISDAPAGDGVANLFKYAFGGSPIISDRSKLPVQIIFEDSGESYLGISFTPDRNFTWDAQSGTFTDGVVTLMVESSTDLSQGSWSPATDMVLVGGGTELTSGQAVTLRLSTPIDSQTAPRGFLRISGERVPAPL